MKPPTEPEVFLKAVTSLAGPDDQISRGPNPGTKLDWEVELAIVVGREARDITAAEAADYIFGYVCLNDISDRTTQVDSEGGQHLVRAKSRPGYTPIGPYLTTGVDGMKLDLWTKVNGRVRTAGQHQRYAVSRSATCWPTSPPIWRCFRAISWRPERLRALALARTGSSRRVTCWNAASPISGASVTRFAIEYAWISRSDLRLWRDHHG